MLVLFAMSGLAAAAQSKDAVNTDVASIDSIIKAVYEVISGEAGETRDWDRFRSLFHQDARLIPTGKNAQTGVFTARAMSAEDYVSRNAPYFAKQGFHEREIARRVDQYGNIAHVFSTYHAFNTKEDKTPFMRGINSFQLLYDGKRWWVMSIYWQAESKETPIPKQYLRSKN